jgi:hypothetical protein
MSIDAGEHELRCLRCAQAVRFEELGGLAADDCDRAYFDCSACGARNEIRAEPQSGLGVPPKAVVVRLTDRH